MIELLEYSEEPGLVEIPKPPGFSKWNKKNAEHWLKINRDSTHHNILVYPKLKYTFQQKYWSISKIERYQIAIEFLHTIKYMARYQWYDPDIHSRNIMCNGLADNNKKKWFIIDYGAMRTTKKDLGWSILALLSTLGSSADYSVYPDDHKSVYKPFDVIKNNAKNHPKYNEIKKLNTALVESRLHGDLLYEIWWHYDFDSAADITGYSQWMQTQPNNIKRKFGRPHKLGISEEDIIYSYQNITDIDKIVKRLKSSLNMLLK